MADLEERVNQFDSLSLSGQPRIMNMVFLVHDLWNEVQRLQKSGPGHKMQNKPGEFVFTDESGKEWVEYERYDKLRQENLDLRMDLENQIMNLSLLLQRYQPKKGE